MKKLFLTLVLGLLATFSFAGNILTESFEYGNHDLQTPIGWSCADNSWLCGYLEKDHNLKPHTGNWYAFTTGNESWMFMPMYLIPEMQYRFSIWAVSDGSYSLSFWAGSAPSSESMTVQFFSESICTDEYNKASAYVESIPEGCNYIGICAIMLQGDSYLSIDDVEIDMVQQYNFEAEAITGDTTMYPGTQAVFHYFVHNTGYDPVDITLHPSNEFFTDFSSYVNGVSGSTFATQPDETVRVTTYATLRPEVQPGTMAWLDIMMTIPCNCNTAMVTFWVTPLDLTQTPENNALNINVFPNPATDHVSIEVEGLQRVSVVDLQGRVIMTGIQSGLDISALEKGLYILSIETKQGILKRSFVKR
jgi:hypothetical protein